MMNGARRCLPAATEDRVAYDVADLQRSRRSRKGGEGLVEEKGTTSNSVPKSSLLLVAPYKVGVGATRPQCPTVDSTSARSHTVGVGEANQT